MAELLAALMAKLDAEQQASQAPEPAAEGGGAAGAGTPGELLEEMQAAMACAERSYRDGRLSAAVAGYTEAASAAARAGDRAQQSACLAGRALAEVQRERYKAAIADYVEAIGLDPNNERAKLRRALALES
eukprot:SAG22_NODE_10145_length_550_cov_1.254989_1_plen_130_part_10